MSLFWDIMSDYSGREWLFFVYYTLPVGSSYKFMLIYVYHNDYKNIEQTFVLWCMCGCGCGNKELQYLLCRLSCSGIGNVAYKEISYAKVCNVSYKTFTKLH